MHQKNETSTTQVKTNNLNLGDNASKILNQSNSTSHNSTTLPSQTEVKQVKLANPNEENSFQKKNPFADFSNFETNIDNMEPIMPDQATKMMTSKIEQKLKNMQKKKVNVGSVHPVGRQSYRP